MIGRAIDGSRLPSPLRGGAGGGGRGTDADLDVRGTPPIRPSASLGTTFPARGKAVAGRSPKSEPANAWEREAAPLSNARTRASATSLRRRLTAPEKRLWWHLRHTLALSDTHFRRQVAIGRYIVDFCCLAERLIVEVDGEQHGFDGHRERDATRTAELEQAGFRVLRFSNGEVMTGTTSVLDTILAACGPTPPTPGPSPQGGGESVSEPRP